VNISLTNQVYVFWASVLGGVITGVIFDFFRAYRKKVKSGAVFVGIQDMLFWLISSGVVFYFMYRFNNGDPRWFIFAGIILGAIIYHYTISGLVVMLIIKISEFIGKSIEIIIKIIIFPVVLIIRIFKKPLLIVAIPIRKSGRFIRRSIRNKLSKTKDKIKKVKKLIKMY